MVLNFLSCVFRSFLVYISVLLPIPQLIYPLSSVNFSSYVIDTKIVMGINPMFFKLFELHGIYITYCNLIGAGY